MRPPSRGGGDPVDPIIRRTLWTWAASASSPEAGRKRLLGAAWLASAARERKPKIAELTSTDLAGTVWGFITAAMVDPAGNSVQRALAGAAVQYEPNGLLAGHIRREGWHPFSMGIGLLTVIR
jgi:hypothetical protein